MKTKIHYAEGKHQVGWCGRPARRRTDIPAQVTCLVCQVNPHPSHQYTGERLQRLTSGTGGRP